MNATDWGPLSVPFHLARGAGSQRMSPQPHNARYNGCKIVGRRVWQETVIISAYPTDMDLEDLEMGGLDPCALYISLCYSHSLKVIAYLSTGLYIFWE